MSVDGTAPDPPANIKPKEDMEAGSSAQRGRPGVLIIAMAVLTVVLVLASAVGLQRQRKYADRLEFYMPALNQQMAEEMAVARRWTRVTYFFTASSAFVLLIAWISVYRTMRRWRSAIRVQNAALARRARQMSALNAELNTRVEARTAELDKERAMIQSIVDTTVDAIVSIDAAGTIIFWNQGAVSLFGYTAGEAVGREVAMIMPERYQDPHRAGMARYLASGQSSIIGASIELEARHKTGREIPVEISLATWKTGAGCHFFTAILRDISARRSAAENEKRLQVNLYQSEKMSSLGTMIAGVAHELNNPLTGILGYADLIRTAANPADCRADIDSIVAEAGRCAKIVRNLLTFARKYNSEAESCRLNEDIQLTVDLCANQLKLDDIALDLKLDPALPVTVADPHLMRQVFLNIVTNAHQAMKSAARPGRPMKLAISSEFDRGTIRIRFADTGPGIPDDHIGKIFDPFFTTKESGKGTGLGLSIVHSIIADHGGTITASSANGGGAMFTIDLPVVADENAAPIASAAVPGGPPGQTRILLVDDEAAIRAVASRMLKSIGYHVRVAPSVSDAAAALRQSPVDVIISDMRMPGGTGHDMYRVVCEEHPALKDMFILFTGDSVSGETSRFIAESGVTVLDKPFDLTQFDHVITDTIKRKRERAGRLA